MTRLERRYLTLGPFHAIIEEMKRLFYLGIGLTALVNLAIQPQVLAQEMLQSTGDTPVDRLQANCDAIQGVLRRLHTNDSLLRVNIGQTYNGISARLMARLNSRLALNRIDSAKFVEISSKFDQQRNEFGTSYSEYESALSALTKIDCKAKPTEFYAALLMARDERAQLYTAVKSMNDSVREYQVAVEELQQSFLGETDA